MPAPTASPSLAPTRTPTIAPAPAGAPAPAAVPAGPPRGRAYARLVLSLGVMVALGPLTIDTYLPALPALAADLGTTEAGAQATLTAILLGLGLGQLVLGPVTDAHGRRRVLLGGLAVHVAGSLVCATAPVVEVLMAGRALQGVGGAAVSVSVMATVRDLYTGTAAATILSRLMLVIGVAPLLAPSIGGLILSVTTWRGVFVMLATAAVLLALLGTTTFRETLPPERRGGLRPRSVAARYSGLLRDRTFMGLVLVAGLAFATLFAYVGSSSFVLQEIYGLSVAQFGVVFAANSVGLTLTSQLNPMLVRRTSSRAVLRAAVLVLALASTTLLLAAATGVGGLATVLAPLWVVLASCGLIFPNTQALALSRHGEAAGTAAAMLGASQFAVGGIAAPLVGLFGSGSAVPMAGVMATAAVLSALVAVRSLRAPGPPPA